MHEVKLSDNKITSLEFQSRESGEMPEQPRYCDRDETVLSHCLRMGRHGSRMNGSQETC